MPEAWSRPLDLLLFEKQYGFRRTLNFRFVPNAKEQCGQKLILGPVEVH
jgi:hypothetical protein